VLSNYLAAALRNLLRNRVHVAINLFGLSVGFAAAMLIALYVRDELSYDRFVPGYRDVYLLTEIENIVDRRFPPIPMDYSLPDLARKLSVRFPQIAAVARIMPASSGQSSFAFADNAPHIRHGQVEADETGFLWVDPSFFRVVPLKSLAGDLQTALATPDSVVLTRTAARKYFGRDKPLGELLEVNPAMGSDAAKVSTSFNTPHPMRVAAVIEDLPSNSYVKGEVFGSSLAIYSKAALYDLTPDQGPFRINAYTFVRLRAGTSVPQMQQELSSFAAHNSSTSTVYPPGFTLGLHLTPIGDLHLAPPGAGSMSPRGDKRFLAALAAVALLIIASASFNFVTLMAARAAQRAIETGVRKAVGALRVQLIIQFMAEAVVYVALAMALAVALAELLLPEMNSLLKQRVAFDFLGDPTLLGALLLTTMALGLLAGAYPALVLSAYRPAAVLKGRLVQGATGGLVRHALVALQFAIMIGLGITAATIWRQTLFSLNNQLRVDGSSILLIDNACAASGQAFRDRVATLPGVAGAVCADEEALGNGGMAVSARIQGRAATLMACAAVDYGALEFYGVRPLAGRFFDRNHGDDGGLTEGGTAGSPSIVISETAMRKLGISSPSQAIGKVVTWNLRRWSGTPTRGTMFQSQIIGVSPDVTLDTRHSVWPQILYVGRNSYSVLSVRLMGSQIPEALTAIDAAWSQTMHTSIQRRFLSRSLQEMYADISLQGTAISLGAGLAGVIAALGLFGLAALSAEQRTKEIGIRKAMGASRADVLRMLLWHFARPVLWANAIAWSAAGYFMHRWLQGFAYHVDLDPLIFLGTGAAALAIALATVVSHALLVARTQPATALRYE
jgi:putative ABC transport system permease protein